MSAAGLGLIMVTQENGQKCTFLSSAVLWHPGETGETTALIFAANDKKSQKTFLVIGCEFKCISCLLHDRGETTVSKTNFTTKKNQIPTQYLNLSTYLLELEFINSYVMLEQATAHG